MSPSTIRPTVRRNPRFSGLWGMALLWLALCGPALAQASDGGLGTAAQDRGQGSDRPAGTTVPPLRGAVEDPADEAAAAPAGFGPDGAAGDRDPAAADTLSPGKARRLRKSNAKIGDRPKFTRVGPAQLPALRPYPTALRLRGSGASTDAFDQETIPVLAPAPGVAALPVEKMLRPRIDDKANDPIGVEVGSLRLTPFVTQSFGYDSNPDQAQTGIRPSAYSRTEGGLGVISQWSRNELKADLHGGYNDYFSDPGANRPDALGTIDLRLDANRDTVLDAEQRFSIDSQRPGAPGISIKTLDRPLITTFGTTLGATESFGRLAFGLHGSFDRTAYDNADLGGGAVEDLANGNYNDFGLRTRASYELTDAVKPFVDVLFDRRIHDATIDLSGYRRDSDGITGQVGTSFEFNRLFSGSIAGGYGTRSFNDPRLKALNGPVFNATLDYAATPITVISLKGSTTFDETTVAGASGSESRSATVQIAHQLLRDLTITGGVTFFNTDYVGAPITENTWSETLKAEYHLSPSWVATASYNHADLHSTQAKSSYAQDVFLLGLRLQR